MSSITSCADMATGMALLDGMNEPFISVPLGIFWDMENCQVPKGCSAFDLVHSIRSNFLGHRREEEFVVVCDVYKEPPTKLKQLDEAQVNVIHVSSTLKNSADEKLRQLMRKYAEIHKAPSALLIITSDINFAGDLKDFQFRKNMEVILLHNRRASQALISCATAAYDYTEFTDQLPRALKSDGAEFAWNCVLISGLRIGAKPMQIRKRLQKLIEKFKGEILSISPPTATLRFPTVILAERGMASLRTRDFLGKRLTVRVLRRPSSCDDGYSTANGAESPQEVHAYPQAEVEPALPECPDPSLVSLHNEDLYTITIVKLPPLNHNVLYKKISEDVNAITPMLNCIIQNTELGVQAKVTVRNVYSARLIIHKLHGSLRPWSNERLQVLMQEDDRSVQTMKTRVSKIFSLLGTDTVSVDELSQRYCLRYHSSITRFDLENLEDMVTLFEADCTDWATLLPNTNSSPTHPYCRNHVSSLDSLDPGSAVRRVLIDLNKLTLHTYILLEQHGGYLPLSSFSQCYESAFDRLVESKEDGVCLELLIEAIPRVTVVKNPDKYITWAIFEEPATALCDRVFAYSLREFERDLSYMFSNSHRSILLSELEAEIHDSQWRHCRHADAGITKLNQITDVSTKFSITGFGERKQLSFSPASNKARWNSNIIKLLEVLPNHQVKICNIPKEYNQYFANHYKPADFGLCYTSDLMQFITPKITILNGDTLILAQETPNTKRIAQHEWADILREGAKKKMAHDFKSFLPTRFDALVFEYVLQGAYELFEHLGVQDLRQALLECGFYVKEGMVSASDGAWSSWIMVVIGVAKLLPLPKRRDWVEFEFKRLSGGTLPEEMLRLTGVLVVADDMLTLAPNWYIILRILHLPITSFDVDLLCRTYHDLYRSPLPHQELGYGSPYEFLKSNPEVFDEINIGDFKTKECCSLKSHQADDIVKKFFSSWKSKI